LTSDGRFLFVSPLRSVSWCSIRSLSFSRHDLIISFSPSRFVVFLKASVPRAQGENKPVRLSAVPHFVLILLTTANAIHAHTTALDMPLGPMPPLHGAVSNPTAVAGAALNMIGGRVAYHLDLHGPVCSAQGTGRGFSRRRIMQIILRCGKR